MNVLCFCTYTAILKVSGRGTQVTLHNCHTQLTYSSKPGTRLAAYTCIDGARLELTGCTVAAAAAPGRWQVAPASFIPGFPQVLVIGAVVGSRPELETSRQPASLSMTDCDFSLQRPAAARAGLQRKAVIVEETGQLEAARCTYSGFGMQLKSKETAHLTDRVIQDEIGSEKGGR